MVKEKLFLLFKCILQHNYLLDFLWTVFQVVDIAVRNRSTRQYLIETVRIVTGISNFVVKVDPYVTEVRKILKKKKTNKENYTFLL